MKPVFQYVLLIIVALPLLLVEGCTHSPPPAKVSVVLDIVDSPTELTPAQRLAALQRVAPPASERADRVADIYAILKAEDYAARQQPELALQHWRQAVSLAQGRFAQMAFLGWATAFLHDVDNRMAPEVFARLVLSELNQGKSSSFLGTNRLTAPNALGKWLQDNLEHTLLASPEPEAAPTQQDSGWPKTQRYLNEDPLLQEHSQIYCHKDFRETASWSHWQKELPAPIKSYWQGLIADCRQEFHAAVSHFEAAYDQLSTNLTTAALAINAGYRLTGLHRWLGDRERMAYWYQQNAAVWHRLPIRPEQMGEDADRLHLRIINDLLWAGRYTALVGQLNEAERYVAQAQERIARFRAQRRLMSRRIQTSLTEYEAEAFHILAYRIALERRQFESALALTNVGLALPDLDLEWKQRFSWFAGFYQYLAGNFEGARRIWEGKLAGDPGIYRARVYFWLARTYDRLSRSDEAGFYQRSLEREFPLSFYTIVAATETDRGRIARLQERFGQAKELAQAFTTPMALDLTVWERDPVVMRHLARAEILIAAGVLDHAGVVVRELTQEVRRRYRIEPSIPAFLYLTRLQYAVGQYFESIDLTTHLADADANFWDHYPEQIYIYFPRPFNASMQRHALSHFHSSEALFAVTRQESAFRPEVGSPAGALGLMQIMPATAQRLALEYQQISSLAFGDWATSLLKPEVNVAVGSAYVSQLYGRYEGFEPAIFAAYNAGEYVVDAWLQRRAHSDPVAWIELVPFGETSNYIRQVWRNVLIYKFLGSYGKEVTLVMDARR